MRESKYIDRNELSILLEVSYDVVRHNEQAWGLTEHMVKFSPRIVRFWRTETIGQLTRLGLLRTETAKTV